MGEGFTVKEQNLPTKRFQVALQFVNPAGPIEFGSAQWVHKIPQIFRPPSFFHCIRWCIHLDW